LARTRRGIDPARAAQARGEVYYPSFSRKWGLGPERHTGESFRLLQTLRHAFTGRPDVYVSGLVRLYYDAINRRRWVAPDVFLALGAPNLEVKGPYRLWEGRAAPDFVIEVAYDEPHREAQLVKPAVYAQLGVRELVYYDPEGDYLIPPLQVYALDGDRYRPVEPTVGGRYESRVLGLELALIDGRLQLLDRVTGERLVRFTGDDGRYP